MQTDTSKHTFYATLGQAHTHRICGVTLDCDSLLEITADNYNDAYEYCNEIFERRWCSLYEPGELRTDLFPRGVVLTLAAPAYSKQAHVANTENQA